VIRLRSRLLLSLLAPVLLASAAVATRSHWLPWFGYALIHDDGPAKADLAVVLAGDNYGYRILKAGELVRAGYVPAALVSGPDGMYGVNESDLAIPFAVRHGFPAEYFIALPHCARSTREEAAVVLTELRRRQVRSFLLVTSDYHTARARRIFHAVFKNGPAFRTVAAPDRYFHAASWWRTREGQKIAFFEWCKTFATEVGL
jgi:uncharacterized SAM-binding protein YcdF (DUF218 family)